MWCFAIILKILPGIIHLCLWLRGRVEFVIFCSCWLINSPVADTQHSWTLLRSEMKRVSVSLSPCPAPAAQWGSWRLPAVWSASSSLKCGVPGKQTMMSVWRWILIHYSQNNNQHLLSIYHKDPRASWSRQPGLESLGNVRACWNWTDLKLWLPECGKKRFGWMSKENLHIQ